MPHLHDLHAQDVTVLALGSNMGPRLHHLCSAIQACAAMPNFELLGWSHCYQTKPWGPLSGQQHDYLNMVLVGQDTLSPEDLLHAIKRIEGRLGRFDALLQPRWGSRVIDIDIIWQRQQQHVTSHLQLPHPRFHQRAFVLKPLVDVLPMAKAPGMLNANASLLAQLGNAVCTVQRYCHASVFGRCHTPAGGLRANA